MKNNMEKSIAIHTETIQLDQLLKWADIIQSGGQVKAFIEDELIFVNGQLCQAKRKQIKRGDRVEIKGIGTLIITGE